MKNTIPKVLRDAAALWKHQPAIVPPDTKQITFIELDELADRIAKAAIADGMSVGQRAAIWAPNIWEWIAVTVGIQRAGGVIVPLNSRLKGEEVEDILKRADVTHLFCIGDFLGKYYPSLLQTEYLPALVRVVVFGENAGLSGRLEESWGDFLHRSETISDAALSERERSITADSVSDIMFTSGTTGKAKGAVFSHRSTVGGGRAFIEMAGLKSTDKYCVFGPFSHTASYKAGWVAALLTGCPVYWPENFDSASVLDLIVRNRISVIGAPPTIWQDMLEMSDWRTRDISSLRFLVVGATVIPIQLIRRLRSETAIDVIATTYGMTECSGLAAYTRAEDSVEAVAYTVGKPVEGTEIRIVDPDSQQVPVNEAGEILIRDDKLMIGYLDDQTATDSAIDCDGWLHTGDIGVIDSQGYLKITDRLKDMFISGGFNVYPAEVERQMSVMPGISQVAVVGRADYRLGEVGHAFVVLAPGYDLSVGDITDWCRIHIANYKCPRHVAIVDDLPRNIGGKVLKNILRDKLQSAPSV